LSSFNRLRLIPGFIEPEECDMLLQKLLHELPWQQETVERPNEVYLQPRMTAWFGDLPYSYSGITHPTNNKVGFIGFWWLPLTLH
jgi:mRNA N1-methyladenine demethylase